MNNISIEEIKKIKREHLEKYGLDYKSIEEFSSDIKKVSSEESNKLGKELLEHLSSKKYYDECKEHYEKVIDLIKNGANVNYKDDKGNFPLLICAKKGYFDPFIALIKAGADINMCNNYGTTATITSARHGHIKILEVLILLGADINARSIDGEMAIMSAKRHDKEECFNALIEAKAYLNIRNIFNETLNDIKSKKNFNIPSLLEGYSNEEKLVEVEDATILLDSAIKEMEKIQDVPEDFKKTIMMKIRKM